MWLNFGERVGFEDSQEMVVEKIVKKITKKIVMRNEYKKKY